MKKLLHIYLDRTILFRILALWLLSAFFMTAYAQERVINGFVQLNEEGPAIGANIIVKGTTTGTLTDEDGKFSLNVPAGFDVLVITYYGYARQEIKLGSSSDVNVTLTNDEKSLQEVVVIGYGTRDKRNITSSIQQVGEEEIQRTVSLSPELALQGNATGVFVSTGSGSPNESPVVRIRGVGTFNENNPLYVIDGIPLTNDGTFGQVNPFNLINPNDIESITVLKDAAASSIYGVRAANGVILITTKKGSFGSPRVDFNSRVGMIDLPETFDVLNVQEYVNLYTESFANAGEDLLPQYDPNSSQYLGNLPFVDWQKEMTNEEALVQDYFLTVRGGNESSNYAISSGYSRYDAPIKFEFNERYNVGANASMKVGSYLDAGLNVKYSHSLANSNTTGDIEGIGGLTGFYRYHPWQPIFDESHPSGFAGFNQFGVPSQPNVFGVQEFQEIRYNLDRGLGTAYIQLSPFKGIKYLEGLDFKGTFSADVIQGIRSWRQSEPFLSHVVDHPPSRGNTFRELTTRSINLVREFSTHYNQNFGDHGLDLLFNAMHQTVETRFISLGDQNITVVDRRQGNIIGPTDRVSASAGSDRWSLLGYLFRVGYNYQNKYYIDATYRRDGSSRFSTDNRWGDFFSASVAWRISDEVFLKNIPFINDLKLRGGWGQLGNQDTGLDNFSFLSKVNRNPQYTLGSGRSSRGIGPGISYSTATLDEFANAGLSWETATTISIGLDFALFKEKLSGTVEWYQRRTEDIIQSTRLPSVVGNIFSPNLNVAEVENRGLEFMLKWEDNIGDFSYFISGNITTQENEVLRTAGGLPINVGELRIEEGQSMFYLYGFQTAGIFQTDEEVAAWKEANSDPGRDDFKAPGDVVFVDIGGVDAETGLPNSIPDSVITETGDRTFLGKTIPGYFYGFTLGANWKGFDLQFFFQGVGDVQRFNQARLQGTSMSAQGGNQFREVLNRWTPSNPTNTLHRAYRGDDPGNLRFSDRYVEDADFIRLKFAQLGYTIPRNALASLRFLENVKVFIGGSNLITLTNWSGLDPENDFQPLGRQFLAGINITFK